MMQVTVGSEWPTDGGGRRSYALTLDVEDLKDMRGEEAVEAMSRAEILTALNKTAEVLVVSYSAKEGAMSQERAAQRIREIKNG